MDFFERQERARRRTKWLVIYFVFAVIGTVAAIYLALLLVFFREAHTLWQPELFLGVSIGTLLVILIGSLSKMVLLREGGGAVARTLGGQLLDPSAANLEEQRLLNVVEEMAIASGTPVPEIYVLSGEGGINAFAAGHTAGDAAIAVTRGSLSVLTRDELQGVVAHEFSHILNGDMRLNLRLIGLIHGILCLAIIGRILLRTSSRSYRLGARNKGGNPLPLVGLVLLVIGSIGVFFGRIIKAAVNRQREFLADAAAVQFTRNPDGLAGALKKIGGLAIGSRLRTPRAEEASHLLFSNGMGESWLNLLSTHPSLTERIRAIDPQFDGTFSRTELPAQPGAAKSDAPPPIPGSPSSRAYVPPPALGDLLGGTAGLAALTGAPIPADKVNLQTGAPTAEHLHYAAAWKQSLPAAILDAAHEPVGGRALVFALLLSAEPSVRDEQVRLVHSRAEPEVAARFDLLQPQVARLERPSRLPLIDLSMTGLRQMTPAQYEQFVATLRLLIEHDRQIDLFEYTLQKIVVRHLEPHFKPPRRAAVQYYSLRPLASHCAVLLSALAYAGHADPAKAQEAFSEGARYLDTRNLGLQVLPPPACDLAQIDAALEHLALASPQIKKQLLDACAHVVASDGLIESGEAELLRAVADTLDCPLPPFIAGVVPR